MILFCGIPSEPPMAMAIDAAQKKRHPFAVLNQRVPQLPRSDIFWCGRRSSRARVTQKWQILNHAVRLFRPRSE